MNFSKMKNNTKIFVFACACNPKMGSEPGVGWHWVLEMAKYFELWVMVHEAARADIELAISKMNNPPNIHFVYTRIPFNSWFSNNGSFRLVRTYYCIWTYLSDSVVKKTMQENDIHIFHHLTFGNAIWAVSRYGQTQKFIWGPIGGVEVISEEYAKHYDFKSRVFEWLRRTIVKSLKYRRGYLNRCKNADLILCKTEAMFQSVPELYRHKAILFTDVAVEENIIEGTDVEIAHSDIVEILSVGRLDAWRGFDLLIEAFEKAKKLCPQIHLTILGNGMNRKRLQHLIQEKNLQQDCSMLGGVPIEQYNRIMTQSDIIVNSCLKEGAVTVSFDSMRYSKPLICIDSGGFTRYFSDDYAIVLPQQKRESLVQSMCDAIVKLALNVDLRKEMGRKAHQAGKQFVWNEKGKQIRDVINSYLHS